MGTDLSVLGATGAEEGMMPIARITMHAGQLDAAGKRKMIQLITDAMVEGEGLGEFSRQSAWVIIDEVPAGNFGAAGRIVDADGLAEIVRQRAAGQG
jgi:4-oxalocrotonate tautomerase family enzyme